MAQLQFPLEHYDWLSARVMEYPDRSLAAQVCPDHRHHHARLLYDKDHPDSRSAARDIASAYAHELATPDAPSWCFDCRAMRHRGDRCTFAPKALSAAEAESLPLCGVKRDP